MRRTFAALAAATSLAFGGAVAVAGPAAAAPSDKAAVRGCPGDDHPGLHLGTTKPSNGERRNVGGTCPAQ